MTQVSSPNTSLTAAPVEIEAGAVSAGVPLARRACQAWSGQTRSKAADPDDREDPSLAKDMPVVSLPLETAAAMSLVVGLGAGAMERIHRPGEKPMPISPVTGPSARSHHVAQLRQSQQLQQSTGKLSISGAAKEPQSLQGYRVVSGEQGARLASDTGAPPEDAMSRDARNAFPIATAMQVHSSNLLHKAQKLQPGRQTQHLQPAELLQPLNSSESPESPGLLELQQPLQSLPPPQLLPSPEQPRLPQPVMQSQLPQQSAQLPPLSQPAGELLPKISQASHAEQGIQTLEAALTESPAHLVRLAQSLSLALHPAMPLPLPFQSRPEPSSWSPESPSLESPPTESTASALALPSSLLAGMQSPMPLAEPLPLLQILVPQSGTALPTPMAPDTASSPGYSPRAAGGGAQGAVAAETPAPRAADGASSLTYRFNTWNDGHSVTVRSMAGADGAQHTLLPSDRLVEQRLAAQWPTVEVGRDRHDARWLLATADTTETLANADTDGLVGRQAPSERHEREDRRNRRQPLPQHQDDEEPE